MIPGIVGFLLLSGEAFWHGESGTRDVGEISRSGWCLVRVRALASMTRDGDCDPLDLLKEWWFPRQVAGIVLGSF